MARPHGTKVPVREGVRTETVWDMSAETLARWQFGVTTIYHFLFVPLTIGLSILVAGMQTAWYRTDNPRWRTLTKFFGKLFLLNFAMGVVTGIVQEFQFGMNWSDYSRFVGDVFGAPLAMEGILAFFLESTFLGLWIFGWDKLPKKVHLACIWLAAIGTNLSAFFILAANSWMQHPVGYVLDPVTHRARLTSIWAVLTNSTALVTIPHTLAAAFVMAGIFVVSVSAYQIRKGNSGDLFRPALKLGAVTVLVAGLLTAITGDLQARIMTKQQPMKMAAAEALYNTSAPASFSLLTIGSLDGSSEAWSLRVPGVLSFMATGDRNGKVEGINQIQAEYAAKYGAGDYKPSIPLAYWTFRLMIGFGLLAAALAGWALWALRKGRTPSRWFWRAATWALALPIIANSTAWLFTEMGRQPWTVFGMLKTSQSASPTVGPWMVATSFIALTVLYAVLAVIEIRLMLTTIRKGPAPEVVDLTTTDQPEPAFAY
jgi:cytochrome d ubiquinol oxidase subunit I